MHHHEHRTATLLEAGRSPYNAVHAGESRNTAQILYFRRLGGRRCTEIAKDPQRCARIAEFFWYQRGPGVLADNVGRNVVRYIC